MRQDFLSQKREKRIRDFLTECQENIWTHVDTQEDFATHIGEIIMKITLFSIYEIRR